MSTQRETYLGFILGPFFRWWWAIITGLATLLSYELTPADGYRVSAQLALGLVLVLPSTTFLAISVLARGWVLFRHQHSEFTVHSILRNRDFGSDWIFVIRTGRELPAGTLLDVHRRLGGVEVPFALIELISPTTDGLHQGVPRWLAPAHIRDFTSGKFAPSDTVVLRYLTTSRIRDLPSVR